MRCSPAVLSVCLLPELQVKAARSYWSKGREDDSDEGAKQYSSPVTGGVCKCHIFTFSYLLLGNKPISGSHFSILLHISPLKEYKG